MPVFHFEVRTPTHVMVTEEMDLPDQNAARAEAAKKVGALLTTHAGQVWVDQEWQMEITNDVGLILYVIQISASNTSATYGKS